LREHEAGVMAADLARRHGISEPLRYYWMARFGGMEVSDARRLSTAEQKPASRRRTSLPVEGVVNGRSEWVSRPGSSALFDEVIDDPTGIPFGKEDSPVKIGCKVVQTGEVDAWCR
jgi:hypothetical protein